MLPESSYVYEEYAKSYGKLGQTSLAFNYVDRAENTGFQTPSSDILFKVTRAEILIYDGDIQSALPLAMEAAEYSRAHGHYRRLERIYGIKHFLNQQALKYNKAVGELSNVLDGPIEPQ